MEAKKSGASKEDLQKLKLKIKDEMMTAKAAGVTIDVSLKFNSVEREIENENDRFLGFF